MNVFTGVGILLLSMLIIALLQLRPGVFLLFNHYASGKYSRSKVSDLSLFFIFGVEIFTAFIFLVFYCIVSGIISLFPGVNISVVYWVLAGIIAAISIIFPFIYYKKSRDTRLFISRPIANGSLARIKDVKTRFQALALGFFSGVPELLFVFPLYFLAAITIQNIEPSPVSRAAIILLFILASVIPLFIIHFSFTRGLNLANIQKNRIKSKPFLRIFISVLLFITAILAISSGVFNQ